MSEVKAATLLLALLLLTVETGAETIADDAWTLDLSGDDWTASSLRGNDSHASVVSDATVPGDIFMDLYKSYKIPDPYLEDNDVKLRWISDREWNYSKTFTLTNEQLKDTSVLMIAEGIDTMASVYLNSQFVYSTDNMFIEHSTDATKFLVPGENLVQVFFQSPTKVANARAKKYQDDFGYSVPPSLQTPFQNGLPNVNFIRKVQSSFSWDWGPGFATVGLWRPLILRASSTAPCVMRRTTAVPIDNTSEWLVHTRVNLWCHRAVSAATVTVMFPDIAKKITWKAGQLQTGDVDIYKQVSIAINQVDRWWPNGYGSQRLYTVVFNVAIGSTVLKSEPIRVGFRKVELVQDAVMNNDTVYGSTFYFKINDLPIFLKGTNWIPNDAFLSRVTDDRLEFLYESMLDVNMNCLLIWGGGLYESDRFYEMADEKGILIWHYAMFAVSLYPTNPKFLQSVKQEITFQVRRLQHHSSIICWSGNVENELGLRDGWFGTDHNTFGRYKTDYVLLYNSTVYGAINDTDFRSRPYLLSSPSNGIDTIREAGVAEQPGSERYGDVHFYDYTSNAWSAAHYPVTRCASEYGFQSLPSMETLRTAQAPGGQQWSYLGPQLFHRQHHAMGNLQMLMQLVSHFKIPPSAPPPSMVGAAREAASESYFLDAVTYLTQAHQAIAYQVETEHYRGQTMCALYWQLNDIWQAPSWASIDYGLKWKMVHYTARRFFAPVIVSPVFVGDHIEVFAVSDLPYDLDNLVFTLDTLTWTNGFSSIYTVSRQVPRLSALHSQFLFSSVPGGGGGSLGALWVAAADFVFRARLHFANGTLAAPESVLLPDRLFDVAPASMGDVNVTDVRQTAPKRFEVDVAADAIAPLLWLDVADVRGFFSDNAFTLTRPKGTVVYYAWKSGTTLEQFRQKLTVKTLRNWYV